jgi:hypothetical protein
VVHRATDADDRVVDGGTAEDVEREGQSALPPDGPRQLDSTSKLVGIGPGGQETAR